MSSKLNFNLPVEDLNSKYLLDLVSSISLLREKPIIPIQLLCEWFERNKDYRYRLYQERKTVIGFFPVEGIYPSDLDEVERKHYFSLLHNFDQYGHQFSSLEQFVKISKRMDFYEVEFQKLMSIGSDKSRIKEWLIKNEETFFKVYLFVIDYYISEEDDKDAGPYFSIILSRLEGEFRFQYEDFKGLVNYWNAYHHYFFVEELYKESEHYSG